MIMCVCVRVMMTCLVRLYVRARVFVCRQSINVRLWRVQTPPTPNREATHHTHLFPDCQRAVEWCDNNMVDCPVHKVMTVSLFRHNAPGALDCARVFV